MRHAIVGAFVAFVVICLSACGQFDEERVPLTIRTGEALVEFQVEIARSESDQKRGLQFRRTLRANEGMIFPLRPPREASFWMKDTLIPLDMIFIRPDGSIARIEPETTPGSLIPIYSGESVGAVLEINGGEARKRGIKEGAKVFWRDSRN